MKLRSLTLILILTLILAACQPDEPPSMYVMEVTREVTRVVTVVVDEDDITDTALAMASATTPAAEENSQTETESVSATADMTATPAQSPTPDVFPTPVMGEIYLASQQFESGAMYWVQPVNQIWVTTTNDEGENIWRVYEDTFVEGEEEFDDKLVAPSGLTQPIRGFGKLWRDNPDLREDLGWATEDEVGYNALYEYHAGGKVTDDMEYVTEPGYHILETRDGTLRFDEETRTWSEEAE